MPHPGPKISTLPTALCYVSGGGAAIVRRDDSMPTSPGKESVSTPPADVIRQELPYRLRQQSLLGEFGRSALQTRDIGQILQRATDDNA
jgi:two-component system, sensor histidine kinase PdtaS